VTDKQKEKERELQILAMNAKLGDIAARIFIAHYKGIDGTMTPKLAVKLAEELITETVSTIHAL
jgi:hypothetical protein